MQQLYLFQEIQHEKVNVTALAIMGGLVQTITQSKYTFLSFVLSLHLKSPKFPTYLEKYIIYMSWLFFFLS